MLFFLKKWDWNRIVDLEQVKVFILIYWRSCTVQGVFNQKHCRGTIILRNTFKQRNENVFLRKKTHFQKFWNLINELCFDATECFIYLLTMNVRTTFYEHQSWSLQSFISHLFGGHFSLAGTYFQISSVSFSFNNLKTKCSRLFFIPSDCEMAQRNELSFKKTV